MKILLALAALALSAGCAARVVDSAEPCPGWTTYTLPAGSCLFAAAAPGEQLSGESPPASCGAPVSRQASTASFNVSAAGADLVSVYCSRPGACTVRIVTPETDADCRDSMGAAAGVAHGAGK